MKGEARVSSQAALQSEREEETRDRAERGSAVRGSDQASVAAEEDTLASTPAQKSQLGDRNKRVTSCGNLTYGRVRVTFRALDLQPKNIGDQ